MEYVCLGKSNLMVSRVGFGAESLNEIDTEENAAILIHKAYDAGINFFDISRTAKDSEKRLGACLSGIRQNVVLSTKSNVSTKKELLASVEESLYALQTDYIDLYQYEIDNKDFYSFEEVSDALSLLKERGKILHYGFATEDLDAANLVFENDFFETLQLPFNPLTTEKTFELVKKCSERDIGFIAMRPLYGGLVQSIPLAQGFFNSHENVVPLWGVRSVEELEQILYFNEHPPVLDENFESEVARLRMFFS